MGFFFSISNLFINVSLDKSIEICANALCWCSIGLISRVFTNGPGDKDSIPDQVKDSKNGT